MRNLSAAQIVEQLVEARRLLQETPDAGSATNIVFMGMGAPTASLDCHPATQSCVLYSRTPRRFVASAQSASWVRRMHEHWCRLRLVSTSASAASVLMFCATRPRRARTRGV